MAKASMSAEEVIQTLDSALQAAEEATFTASPDEIQRPCTFTILTPSFGTLSERKKPRRAEVMRLVDGELYCHAHESILPGFDLDMLVRFRKTGAGESFFHCRGQITHSKRVSGHYDMVVQLESLEKQVQPAYKHLLDYAIDCNFAAWNRWCSDLTEGPVLNGLDLGNMNLSNFDFCAADMTGCNLTAANLSYCNLSGANLTGCKLDMTRLTGADLFRVTIPRRYMGLISASGLVEMESVILVD